MQIDKRYLREAVNTVQHALTGRTDSRVVYTRALWRDLAIVVAHEGKAV